MKKLFIISILVTSIIHVVAQKNDTIYYDSKGVSNKTLASFMRVVYPTNGSAQGITFKDFFMTGELQTEGLTVINIDHKDTSKDKFKGHQINYYKSGQKQFEITRNDSCLFDGEYNEFYEDGKTKVKGIYKNSQLDGEYNEFNKDGTTKVKGIYKNGKFDGELTQYYENGNLKQVDVFLNNIIQESTFYDEKGLKNAMHKGTIINGLFNGEQTNYYENGLRKSKGIMKNGKWDGLFYQFNVDGSYAEVEMKEGVRKNDYFYFYHIDGKKTKMKNTDKQ